MQPTIVVVDTTLVSDYRLYAPTLLYLSLAPCFALFAVLGVVLCRVNPFFSPLFLEP